MAKKDIRTKYLKQYAFTVPLPASQKGLTIIIPAYAEHSLLPETLDSLEQIQDASKFRVIVVVNHGPQAPDEAKETNDQVWNLIQQRLGKQSYDLLAIDGRQKGIFATSSKIGVGLARKVGMDSALASYQGPEEDCLLVCLDADCLVSANYATELLRWTRDCRGQGTVNIPFEHRLPEDLDRRQAIVTYELFLRYYVGGLQAFDNPYGHHSMGSAFATRGRTYCAVRGMARRRAAEDFYFLDKARKIAPIGTLLKARVFPSARVSDRVIFGTGRTMLKAEEGDPLRVFYDLRTFQCLHDIRVILSQGGEEQLLERLGEEMGIALLDYLKSRHWQKARDQLFLKRDGVWRPRGRFDDWFDGLETLKLVHFIRDQCQPPKSALEVMPGFAKLLGEESPADDLESWLLWAREQVP